MRKKVLLFLFIGIFMISSIGPFAETKKIIRVGVNPLVKGGVTSVEMLKTAIWKYDKEIKFAFDKTGCGDLYLAFMNRVNNYSFEEKTLEPGEKMEWMIFRPYGKVKVTKDLEWAGKKALTVFSMTLVKDGRKYEFVIPKKCGNICLHKVGQECAICDLKVSPAKANINDTITIDMSNSKYAESLEVEIIGPDGTQIASKKLSLENAKWETSLKKPGEYTFKGKAINSKCDPPASLCEQKIYINFPPECCIKISKDKEYANKAVVIDASCAKDPDGKIVKAYYEVSDKDGKVIDKITVSKEPFVWEKKFNKAGPKTISLKLYDDFGGVSEICTTNIEVLSRHFFLVEGIPMLVKGSYSAYLFGRVGWGYWINPEKLDLTLSAGGALSTKSAPHKSFVMANLILNYHVDKLYFGGGLGVNTKVKENYWDGSIGLVANIGYNLFNKNNSIGSIFGELRTAFGEDYSFSHQHMLLLGFRYTFGL